MLNIESAPASGKLNSSDWDPNPTHEKTRTILPLGIFLRIAFPLLSVMPGTLIPFESMETSGNGSPVTAFVTTHENLFCEKPLAAIRQREQKIKIAFMVINNKFTKACFVFTFYAAVF
jgi:hypothetical protein